MLTKREVIALAIESTYNTDANPGASDAMLVEDVGATYEGARMIERAPIKSTLGKEQSVFGGSLVQLTFSVELKGSGAAGTAPEIGQALRACGLDETIVGGTSVTYAPVSASIESATISYYQDGKLQKATGCRGTVEFSFNVGEIAKANFTFTGHDAANSDTTILAGTYDSTVPPPVINGSFSVGGYSAVIAALNFSLNNEIATPPDFNAADGFSDVIITDRDMAGSFDPEYTLNADQNWISDWKSGANKAINTGVIGGTAGNRFALSIPTAYYREIGMADRDSVRTLDIAFGASGDDSAFSLQFT